MGSRVSLNRTKRDRAAAAHVAGVPRDIYSSPNQPNLSAFCLLSVFSAYSSKYFGVGLLKAFQELSQKYPKSFS